MSKTLKVIIATAASVITIVIVSLVAVQHNKDQFKSIESL
jgi:hypothetical protein